MSDTPLLISTDAQVLRLILNRPDKRNALSRALIRDLTGSLRAAAADPEIRCVVLSGNGPAFCAGLDLKEVADTSPEQAEQDAEALVALFETLDNLPKPVIACLHGPAVAGGAGLASVCDIVLAARSATLGYPEVKRGLIAAVVMTYLRRLVGERHAKFLLLTGESISATRAAEIGLVTEVVAEERLAAQADAYAKLLCGYPPAALAASKALWSRIRPLQHAEAVREARATNAAMRLTAESRARAQAFLAGES